MKFPLGVKYKIGEIISGCAKLYSVIGYEYVEGRGLRYILASVDKEGVQWTYLYEFEIKNILTSDK